MQKIWVSLCILSSIMCILYPCNFEATQRCWAQLHAVFRIWWCRENSRRDGGRTPCKMQKFYFMCKDREKKLNKDNTHSAGVRSALMGFKPSISLSELWCHEPESDASSSDSVTVDTVWYISHLSLFPTGRQKKHLSAWTEWGQMDFISRPHLLQEKVFVRYNLITHSTFWKINNSSLCLLFIYQKSHWLLQLMKTVSHVQTD